MKANLRPVFSAETITKSLELVSPSWPLQNTVAVNPFWFLRHQKFDATLESLYPILHASLYMPMQYYLEAFARNEISKAALKQALGQAEKTSETSFKNSDDFIRSCRLEEIQYTGIKTLAEFFSDSSSKASKADVQTHQLIIDDLGKYCAAYLDNYQSIAGFAWKNLDFWCAWQEAQQNDVSMKLCGLFDSRNIFKDLKSKNSEEAIGFMLEKMNLNSDRSRFLYLQRLIAGCLGWATQFKHAEWQRDLGYPVKTLAVTQDLLAVRMAYDYGIFSTKKMSTSDLDDWRYSFQFDAAKSLAFKKYFEKLNIFQTAFEITYQNSVASKILSSSQKTATHPIAQLAFCIDVRSEMIRRNIEQEDKNLQTIGFAGFFGLALNYRDLEEQATEHRLPTLLASAFEVREVPLPNSEAKTRRRLLRLQIMNTLRALRKNPLSSFLYVELFGILYIERALRRNILSFWKKLKGRRIPYRFDPQEATLETSLSTKQKAELTENILRHLGLTENFASFVFIVGHGSLTTNNAFGSSLDCGACGGHPGDINARLLVSFLNDQKVRSELSQKGITIPTDTIFLAAVHETVTDEIYIFHSDALSLEKQPALAQIQSTILRASKKTREERLQSRSNRLDKKADRRTHNWSETRPEWGLAGNASFIVAPRHRTHGVSLDSRAFLHDYDWKKDEAHHFKTLELIMTAPMVVTNWINLQYYASTVSPSIYGAGNKTIHNLTNESGVFEGNGGDLRVGLPIQSIHDGKGFVHEPLRLSVFIEAPQEQIEKIIERHETVRQLCENNWLHLLQIDSTSLQIYRRQNQGVYTAL